jgi:hypothetical protein
MKKYIYMSMMAAALLTTGCAGEEDDLFEASAAERLNEASGKYSALLESSAGGWVIQYYPTNDGAPTTGEGYLWCVKFNKDHSVLVGMNNYFSGNNYKEETSCWDVITDNGPVLSFSTANSLVHAFSDPDVQSVPGSDENVWGVGVGGDYEFVIVDAPEDHSYIMLKGKKRATYNLMTPLPEGVDFSKYLAEVDSFQNRLFPATVPNPSIMDYGNDDRFYVNDIASKVFTTCPVDGDAITETEDHVGLFYKNGSDFFFRLRSPFSRNEFDTDVQEFRYVEADDEFVAVNHPEVKFVGYDATKFFGEYVASSKTWSLSRNGSMSEKMQASMDKLSEQFAQLKDSRKRSYSFVGLSHNKNVKTVNGQRDAADCWNVVYRAPGSSKNTSAAYVFNVSIDQASSSVAFAYQQPRDDAAGNVYKTLSGIEEVLSLMNRKFIISAADTKFNLSRIKLVAADDPDLWMIVNI